MSDAGIITQSHIDWLQRKIIVLSYIYYELHGGSISDREYDLLCKRVVDIKNDFPDMWKKSEYYKQFGEEYDGCTGFDLYYRLSEPQKEIITSIAYAVSANVCKQSKVKSINKK